MPSYQCVRPLSQSTGVCAHTQDAYFMGDTLARLLLIHHGCDRNISESKASQVPSTIHSSYFTRTHCVILIDSFILISKFVTRFRLLFLCLFAPVMHKNKKTGTENAKQQNTSCHVTSVTILYI